MSAERSAVVVSAVVVPIESDSVADTLVLVTAVELDENETEENILRECIIPYFKDACRPIHVDDVFDTVYKNGRRRAFLILKKLENFANIY
jgi:hypothetical protein